MWRAFFVVPRHNHSNVKSETPLLRDPFFFFFFFFVYMRFASIFILQSAVPVWGMCVNREHIHLCEYRISVFDPFSCGHSALCVTLRSLVSPSCWWLRALQAARSLEGFPRSWHITVVIVTTRTHIHTLSTTTYHFPPIDYWSMGYIASFKYLRTIEGGDFRTLCGWLFVYFHQWIWFIGFHEWIVWFIVPFY